MPASATVKSTAMAVLRRLLDRNSCELITAERLAEEFGLSPATMHRALRWLREDYGAPLRFDRTGRGWVLPARWRPLLDLPTIEDVAALHTAGALAAEHGWPSRVVELLDNLAEGLERKLAESHG